ncbi:MAG: DUF1211 domain-containing protein [Candidatus Eisenbacteria bacterium]|nr:DUF1211 domain-containing protein [Candidatus Eisenbacteria bacterium]
MTRGRLEAFSDGVVAIIITIMVLELKVPHEPSFRALLPMWPVFLSYVLSYVMVGIYWNNHHHLLHVVQHVNGRVLWANLHLLFWLSLLPFVTAWMGETGFGAVPAFAYGVVLLMAAIAYYLLVRALLALHGSETALARAIGGDFKGRISVVMYLTALATTFFVPGLALALYAAVAVVWLVPDRRIEDTLKP